MSTLPSALPSATPTLRDNSSEGAGLVAQNETQHDRDAVNVAEAEREFNTLARQLTMPSHRSRSRSRSRVGALKRRWRKRKSASDRDVEKFGEKDGDDSDSDEPFDLRAYLTSSNDKHQAAGIKHKHVGVVWQDLEVNVYGGMDFKVRESNAFPPHAH